VQINYEANQVLQAYFTRDLTRIEKWFNVIAPKGGTMGELRAQITRLRAKKWSAVHSL